MCGIIGVVGHRDPVPILLSGLHRLEYRGYDSAGIAVSDGRIQCCRAQGKINRLEQKLADITLSGSVGIGHTRWATHGAPCEANAHPITTERVAVVHNGIIENHDELRLELQAAGYRPQSETDTECVAGLMTIALDKGLQPIEAMKSVLVRLHGSFALVVLIADQPEMLLCARHDSPLAIGHDDGAMYVGSDALALAPYTHRLSYLDNDDWGVITPLGMQLFDANGKPVQREVRNCNVNGWPAGKGRYRHYMAKEIGEQPRVIEATLRMLDPDANGTELDPLLSTLDTFSRVTIVACGTSYYAAATARYWFEGIAHVPLGAEIASEFRYQRSPQTKEGLSLFVSQSGETADTLACLRDAKESGRRTLALTNCSESSMAREADSAIVMPAGPEIGVAATKTFTAQLAALACLSIANGHANGTIDRHQRSILLSTLAGVPDLIKQFLNENTDLDESSSILSQARHAIYLGRGSAYPIALEGALKLKEISYVHAEGFAAGEMKHGPIALIDRDVPVVILAPPDELFDKIAANIHEVSARGGRIILISDASGHARIASQTTAITRITVPWCDPFVAPILYAVPVQLLAYQVACRLGTDIDQPRNLAKSVTVE